MISNISAYSPNFSGRVRIGNAKTKMGIAETILKVPEEYRNGFIDELNRTKSILAITTPKSSELTLNVEEISYGCNGKQNIGIHVSATDDNNPDEFAGMPASMYYISGGKKNDGFAKDMKREFSSFQEDVTIYANSDKTPEEPRSIPQTTRDVLGRLY